jgi:sugar lactone lactonase YvrE
VADATGSVTKITPGGAESTFASGLGTPYGMAFDSSGNLYVNAGSVIKITPGGVESTFASGFTSPGGLSFDPSGNLYAVDEFSGSIYKVTPGGAVSTFASGYGNNQLTGDAIDSSGNLYVAEELANSGAILKFTPGGTVSTFASALSPNYIAFQPSAVPEPNSSVMAAIAVGSLVVVSCIRRRRAFART